MKKSRTTIFVAILAVLLAVSGFFIKRTTSNSPLPRSSGETLSIIKSANIVEVLRVKRDGPFGSKRIEGYAVVGKGLTPNAKTSGQLKAMLLTHLRAQANPMGQKGCPPPEPGISIRFIHDDKFVDILVCFQCYDLMVVNDTSSQWRDFNLMPERNALIKIAQALFPGDSEIQKLSPPN